MMLSAYLHFGKGIQSFARVSSSEGRHWVDLGEVGKASSLSIFCDTREQAEAIAAAMTMHQVEQAEAA